MARQAVLLLRARAGRVGNCHRHGCPMAGLAGGGAELAMGRGQRVVAANRVARAAIRELAIQGMDDNRRSAPGYGHVRPVTLMVTANMRRSQANQQDDENDNTGDNSVNSRASFLLHHVEAFGVDLIGRHAQGGQRLFHGVHLGPGRR